MVAPVRLTNVPDTGPNSALPARENTDPGRNATVATA